VHIHKTASAWPVRQSDLGAEVVIDHSICLLYQPCRPQLQQMCQIASTEYFDVHWRLGWTRRSSLLPTTPEHH
jgi:hypothetical protein